MVFFAAVGQARSSEIDALRVDPAELLINAAAQGDVAKLKVQLSKRVNVDVMSSTPSRATALIQASANGHREIVSLLLASGASVNHVDGMGQVALSAAAYHGRIDVAKLLMSVGADVNGAPISSIQPLVAAVMSGNFTLVELMLDQGATIKQSIDGTPNALVAAARQGNTRVVQRLLQALKTTVSSDDSRQLIATALSEARRAQHSSVVATLSAELP
jgi:uncharacterized protein